ncbi:MAG: hypothetical protein JXR67_07935 [Bacteroidales bacterium]|nr:hypothetical protein [Bacteroidales bacterium]
MKSLKRRIRFFISLISFYLICLPFTMCSEARAGAVAGDTVDIQVLYNGRAWRNIYYKIQGDQFLFNSGFIPGSVTMRGRTFQGQSVRYDCYNDELLLLTGKGIILQLNKELVDGFTLEHNNRSFIFRHFKTDTVSSLTGFLNVLSEGNASLYVKYSKEVLILAIENRYDIFTETIRMFVEKDGIITRIGNRGTLLRLLADRKQQVRNYMKSNSLRFSKKDPESIRPVIDYYNSLQQNIPE